MHVTKRTNFYTRNGMPRTFHIETSGCIVNITVGLLDDHGHEVTRVDVLPEDESRGGDGYGRYWHQDGPRIVRLHENECPPVLTTV